MDVERYPGERRGLTLFLSELLPAVEHVTGRDCVLYHRVRRALRQGDLVALRGARQMFNNQPRPLKQRLSVAMYAAAEPAPTRAELLDRYSHRRPAAFVRFEATLAGRGERADSAVDFGYELLEPAPLQVLVRPDSLPSTVAACLRRLADRVESDRRLLSSRHWRRVAAEAGLSGAGGAEGDSADLA